MRQSRLILVIGAMVVLGSLGEARGASPSKDTATLAHLLDEWATAWSSNNVEKFRPLFTDDVYYEDVTFGAINKGSDAARQFATGTFEAFADLSFDLKSKFVAEDGKWGAMEWVWHGRQTKDFPGLPATNKPFQVRGATIVEFRDGKISRNSDYWDLATYKIQVGLTK